MGSSEPTDVAVRSSMPLISPSSSPFVSAACSSFVPAVSSPFISPASSPSVSAASSPTVSLSNFGKRLLGIDVDNSFEAWPTSVVPYVESALSSGVDVTGALVEASPGSEPGLCFVEARSSVERATPGLKLLFDFGMKGIVRASQNNSRRVNKNLFIWCSILYRSPR